MALLRRLGTLRCGDRSFLGRLHPAGAQPPRRRGGRGAPASSPCARRCSARGRNSDLVLPMRPLGCDARRRRRARRSATASRLDERVESLDDLDADAIVVAVPPRESARLLGEPDPRLEDSPIVSVHLWFDRILLRDAARRAARLRCALGLRPRRAHRPPAGARPVSDRRLERRARAARDPRPRARRADRRPAHRAARPARSSCGRASVASRTRPSRCGPASCGPGRRRPPRRRARGHVDRHRLAGDDGERRAQRTRGRLSTS